MTHQVMTTGGLLRELREAGLTQTEIAKRTGIPQPRISRWQAGAVPDSVDDALKLLELRCLVCAAAANNPEVRHAA